jgi:predicted ATPase
MAGRDMLVTPLSFRCFGELLRFLRKRAHLSQRDLAARVGYHYSHISRIESGLHIPDEATLRVHFIPALNLNDQPEWGNQLIELAVNSGQFPRTLSRQQASDSAPDRACFSQLPVSLTSLLGREHESMLLQKLLLDERARLITVVGPPGVGKTSLALHIAEQFASHFRHGVVFVDLAPIGQADCVLPAMVAALGLQESVAVSHTENLKTALQKRNLLIVMDNFEQVVEAAPLLVPLLGNAPEIKILATSREALRLRGEHEFPLAPFPVPDVDSLDVDRLQDYPAIQLFFERAQAIQPDFELYEETVSYMTQVCRRLDGLPLAIELAAARIRTLSLPAMLEQLDHRYEWLTRGGRDLPVWRQTLWGAVEWSYNLLTEQEQSLFRSLSVFSGGWTAEAAEAVFCSQKDSGAASFLSLLLQLVDKSLVVVNMEENRYYFLETLREFACEKLKQNGDLELAQQRHSDYYLKFLQEVRPYLLRGGNQVFWLERLEHEHNNLRAALTWVTGSPDHAATAMQIGTLLHPFWMARSHISEAREWLTRILALDPAPSLIRANLLRFASDYASSQGDYENARIFEEEGMAISKILEDEVGVYYSMEGLATLAGMQGDYVQAAELLGQVLAYRQQTNDVERLTTTLNNLALATRRLGNIERSRELYTVSIAAAEKTGNLISLAHALNGLAEVCEELQDYASAVKLQRRSIAIRYQLGNLKGLVFSLATLASLMAHLGDSVLAAVLKSTSVKICEDIGLLVSPATQQEYETFIAELCSDLGEVAFKDAWSDGQTLPLSQVIRLALGDDRSNAV